jgi:hypothetical protein
MPLSQNQHDLFHQSNTADKMSLFESLLDLHELTSDEALALLGSIHADLRQLRGQDGAIYAYYARMIGLLNHEMPAIHQHVVANWQISKEES